MSVLGQLAYMVAFLAVGVGASHRGWLEDHHIERLTDLAFYVALPALVFGSTYDMALAELVSPALLVGFWVVIAATVALGWLVHRRKPTDARRSVAVVQSYHGNLGFLGLPVVAATLGPEATAVASVILGLGTLTHIPITVPLLVRGADERHSIRGELRSLATNPVLVALAAGVAGSVVGLSLPAVIDTTLEGIATLALPLALICIGGSLDTDIQVGRLRDTSGVVALKVVWMPVAAYLVYSTLGLGPTALAAGVLMLGTPSAVSTYVYASELGGDATFASLNVFSTTVASLVTLSVLGWALA